MALDLWNDGPTKKAIIDFVEGPAQTVAPEERIATFDNDGTLWCEKPTVIQGDFIRTRLSELGKEDRSLVKSNAAIEAAVDGDLKRFAEALANHNDGDDTDSTSTIDALLAANPDATTQAHAERVKEFFATAEHPTLKRPYSACGYAPMIELLRYLEANGFTVYIVSGGGRDFMRPITPEIYGIPPERVIGSTFAVHYVDGEIEVSGRLTSIDIGRGKPESIWGGIGRRPLFAMGNSDGDIEMLEYATTGTNPGIGLLVNHDDAQREFDYTKGAEKALPEAAHRGWTVVSIKDDWVKVFAD
jgi:phosphoglycolate phosphatase-like HAD superfamily hydrolase